ncbi:MAG: pyridine nucleotide-disulfide oxidoreductase [Methylophaga sp.]|nr:MAG: pyridine nucleotide-disulfide oxidoreductase [Methylophaga sp.]
MKRRSFLKGTLTTSVTVATVNTGLLTSSKVLAEPNNKTTATSDNKDTTIGKLNLAILGSGFAALTAVRQTRKNFPDADITVIAPQAKMVYLPSLIWIPSGLREASDLEINLTDFFDEENINFIAASVENVTHSGRTVVTDKGSFNNDGLIIATGGRFINKLPGLEHVITPCKGIAAAEQIKQRLESMTGGTIAVGFSGNPKDPAAVRGGPMFEFLFGIDTLLRRQDRRDKFKLVFFVPSKTPGKKLGEKVPKALLELMAEKGIETHLGHKIVKFEKNKVITKGGEIIADLILFMPGRTGPAWLDNSELVQSEGGLIKANKFCQVEGLKATYVAGDSGNFPGPKWQAKQAHSADLQATAAANNLLQELEGESQFETFKHEIVCIVDTLSHGIYVKRTAEKQTLRSPSRLMHFAKRGFETVYLRHYR